MEGEVVTSQEIFRFHKRGIAQDGKVVGSFEPTGVRPRFTERLQVAGIELPTLLFAGAF